MHYFIFPDKDSYISQDSPSNVILYRDSKAKNYGGDEILELKKDFQAHYYTSSFGVSRLLLKFDYTNISESISNNEISSNAKYYLRLYEVEGQSELEKDYTINTYPLSQSWDQGIGKRYDTPAEQTDGVSWNNSESGSPWDISVSMLTFGGYYSEFEDATLEFGEDTVHDFVSSGSRSEPGGGVWIPTYESSQSFSYQSPDVEMDVTNIVNQHINDIIPNYGFILKFSGSYEDDGSRHNLKFFSKDTHTIYAPRLEVRWDDHIACSGSNTGSLVTLTMSGELDNHIFMKGLKFKYTEDETVRFRIGCRKKYVQKTFTESVHNSEFYIKENRGYYSFIDVATDTPIVPFSGYTKLSCDNTSLYFDQILSTFEPGRFYKILFKIIYDDGQEVIYDNNEEFKIV